MIWISLSHNIAYVFVIIKCIIRISVYCKKFPTLAAPTSKVRNLGEGNFFEVMSPNSWSWWKESVAFCFGFEKEKSVNPRKFSCPSFTNTLLCCRNEETSWKRVRFVNYFLFMNLLLFWNGKSYHFFLKKNVLFLFDDVVV